MHTFPILTTPRLTLRQLTPDDFPALVRHADNKKISERVLNLPYPFREHDAVFRIRYVIEGFKSRARYVFAVVLKEHGELIGEIALHPDPGGRAAQLAYWIGEPYWDRGLATEAATAVIAFGFDVLGLELIYASCHVDNTASERVLAKSGMERHGAQGGVALWRVERTHPGITEVLQFFPG